MTCSKPTMPWIATSSQINWTPFHVRFRNRRRCDTEYYLKTPGHLVRSSRKAFPYQSSVNTTTIDKSFDEVSYSTYSSIVDKNSCITMCTEFKVDQSMSATAGTLHSLVSQMTVRRRLQCPRRPLTFWTVASNTSPASSKCRNPETLGR